MSKNAQLFQMYEGFGRSQEALERLRNCLMDDDAPGMLRAILDLRKANELFKQIFHETYPSVKAQKGGGIAEDPSSL